LEHIEDFSVYARVQPEHKVRIVKAWQADKGKITAMTGDGVNDAPSIKNADIGVGMGIPGTDVTKMLRIWFWRDNFATIVSAVEEGRRIYDNIRKSVQFLLASTCRRCGDLYRDHAGLHDSRTGVHSAVDQT
jgi:Ca2+-transporting ATPase